MRGEIFGAGHQVTPYEVLYRAHLTLAYPLIVTGHYTHARQVEHPKSYPGRKPRALYPLQLMDSRQG